MSLKYLFTSFLLASRFVEACPERDILILRRSCFTGLKIFSENFLAIVKLPPWVFACYYGPNRTRRIRRILLVELQTII